MGATCGSEGTSGPELDYGSSDHDAIKEKFVQAGQGHVFNAWGDMDNFEKERVIAQCQQFDVNQMNSLYENLVVRPQVKTDSGSTDFDSIDPEYVADKTSMSRLQKSGLQSVGQTLIRDGQVGVVVLAGGQGSRLGFDGPKGKFDIGLPSGKSLFQILAERFFKAQLDAHELECRSEQLANGTSVPVVPEEARKCKMFIMTSYENHDETVEFFRENAYFGGGESSFVFFPQQMLPALDTSGKIMLKSYCELKLAPNGNGALFEAVRSNVEVQRAISAYQYLQIIGVDNALNKVLDPIQVGFMHERGLQTCLKACAKRNAAEKVGVIGTKNGRYDIVEYSELPPELAGRQDFDGNLKFYLGNILVYICRTDFLLTLCASEEGGNSLYHKAHKKIEHCDPETWEDIKPSEENGWKFELFLHSFLPKVDQGRLGVLLVDRATEFAPIKEKDGPEKTTFGYDAEPVPDTPAWARRMIMAEASAWLASAEAGGLKIDASSKGNIEVSYLLSYAGENLKWLKNLHKGSSLGGKGGYLNHEGEYFELE